MGPRKAQLSDHADAQRARHQPRIETRKARGALNGAARRERIVGGRQCDESGEAGRAYGSDYADQEAEGR